MRANSFHFKLIALQISAGLVFLCLVGNVRAQTPASTPLVRAVLFYISTCSHCQQLVAEVLPPIQDKYMNLQGTLFELVQSLKASMQC